jgi:hypothetical protein
VAPVLIAQGKVSCRAINNHPGDIDDLELGAYPFDDGAADRSG